MLPITEVVPRPPRGHHSEAEKRALVQLVLDEGLPLTRVARSHGVDPGSLCRWVQRERQHRLNNDPRIGEDRIQVLNRKIASLEQRVEVLRSAVEKLLARHGGVLTPGMAPQDSDGAA